MDLEFKVRSHPVRKEEQVIEVWKGNLRVAAIHPYENGFRVASNYLSRTEVQWGEPPSVLINLSIE